MKIKLQAAVKKPIPGIAFSNMEGSAEVEEETLAKAKKALQSALKEAMLVSQEEANVPIIYKEMLVEYLAHKKLSNDFNEWYSKR